MKCLYIDTSLECDYQAAFLFNVFCTGKGFLLIFVETKKNDELWLRHNTRLGI